MTKAFFVTLLLLLAGCGSLQEQYVDADRKTRDAVWPEYSAYFEADPELDERQKERRRRTGRAWDARLAEGGDQ